MPHLSRLRLMSVGHGNARFEDLTLDFRDIEGRATDSTLWLRNAGGKTSLLNLFFSGIRPGRRQFLGKRGDSKRELEEYVQQNDRAVVAYEWELDGDGGLFHADGHVDRLVTGAFYERRNGELKPLFFATRVNDDEPKLTLEGLPLYREEGGRRVSRRGALAFKQEWMALQKRYASCHVFATEVQSEWKELLEAAGVDPELFRYQVAMNHREGGADELFRFESHDQFVDFLIELVLDAGLGESVRRNLDRHREDLRRRKHRLIPERSLVGGLLLRLAKLQENSKRREELRRELGKARSSSDDLIGYVRMRSVACRQEAERLDALRDQELASATDNEEKAKQKRHRAATSRLLGAERRFHRIEEEYVQVQRRLDEATHRRAVWEAAIPMRNAKRYERRASDYLAELKRKRTEHQPLFEELSEAAGRYSISLRTKVDDLRRSDAGFRRQEQLLGGEIAQTRLEISKATIEIATGRNEAGRLELLLEDGRKRRTQLLAEEILLHEESGAACVDRLIRHRDDILAQVLRIDSDVHDLRGQKDRLVQSKETASLTASQAADRERQAQEVLDQAWSTRRKLEENQLLKRVLEVEQVNLEQVTDVSLELLHRKSSQSLDRTVGLRIARVGDERAVHYLQTRGLLPPSSDVEKLLGVLTPQVRAWSGWVYICDSMPDPRSAVERSPELALGVIVPDADFESARKLLAAADVYLESPVVLAPQSAFDSDVRVQGVVVGPSTNAYFDKSAARQEQVRREAQLEQNQRDLSEAELLRRQLADLERDLRDFREAYSRGWFTEQERTVEQHRQSKRSADDRIQDLISEIRATSDKIDGFVKEANALRSEPSRLEGKIHRVRDFVDRFESLADEREELIRKARHDVSVAEDKVEQWNSEIESKQLDIEKARRSAHELAIEIGATQSLYDQIEYRPQTTVPSTADLLSADELRDRYRRLKAQYEENVGADGLAQLARENEENARRERHQLLKQINDVVTEAVVEAALATLADPEQAEDSRRDANEAYTAAFSQSGNSKKAVERLEKRVQELVVTCRSLGAPEKWVGDDVPADENEAERIADECDAQADHFASLAKRHFEAATDAETKLGAAGKSKELMTAFEGQLETLFDSYGDLLTAGSRLDNQGTPAVTFRDEQIRTEIQQLKTELERLKRDWAALDAVRRDAAQEIRNWAGDVQFEQLTSQVARQFRTMDDATLEIRSAEFAEELQLRTSTIEEKLTEIDRNREQLVSELEALAEDGLSVLRSAANQSKLPDKIPDVGGVQFLTVSMKLPDDPTEYRGRLGELVDEFIEEESTPSGIQLIQRSVRRLARSIQARVLNPDPNLKGQRLDIPALSKFSGGERITCAVLLYCTLANLRARKRGLFRKPTGVLLLDNPIGSSSRVSFLNLQRDVARESGIQLIYTTGVNDYEALRPFPNVIRLRNDRANRRTGDHVVEHDTNGEGGIDAARIVRDESADSNGHASDQSESQGDHVRRTRTRTT